METRKVGWWLAVVAALIILGGLIWLFYRGQSQPPTAPPSLTAAERQRIIASVPAVSATPLTAKERTAIINSIK